MMEHYEYHYWHLSLDLVDISLVLELFAPNRKIKTTYNFINKSLKPIDRQSRVTDLKPGYYEKIMI